MMLDITPLCMYQSAQMILDYFMRRGGLTKALHHLMDRRVHPSMCRVISMTPWE